MYLWLKGLHLAAVLTWVGGLVLLGTATAALHPSSQATLLPHEKRLYTSIVRWDRFVTVPAMLTAWILGITLASWSGVFGAPWLNMKLIFVVALSGLHGVLAGSLRRRLDQPHKAMPKWIGLSPALTIGGLWVVALLVILKP